MRLKQRIVRILIQEIVADVDEAQRIIVLVIHWTGGRHSELRVKPNAKGRHGRCTSLEALGVVRQMAMRFSDQQIAVTLNRLGLLTGNGNTWTEGRVCSARGTHGIAACDRTAAARASDTRGSRTVPRCQRDDRASLNHD